MEDINDTLARNIVRYRKRMGLTQRALARLLGVTFQAVSKWETGRSTPDISMLPLLAAAFDCTLDELFFKEGKPKPCDARCDPFPWADDGKMRVVICNGRKMVNVHIIETVDDFYVKFC